MKTKSIILLIGQKGSGKSYIGSLLERVYGITFIRVEDWAKEGKRDRDVENEVYLNEVFKVIEDGIRNYLDKKDTVVFESTGLTDFFDRMLEQLRNDYKVITIGVHADHKLCLERVKTRDQKIYINVSDHQVNMINERVRQRRLRTDFQIQNDSSTEKDLIDRLSQILATVNKGSYVLTKNKIESSQLIKE